MNNYDRKLMLALLLVAFSLCFKLLAAFWTNSLALFSDSLHLVTDLLALFISWLGLKAALKPADHKHTFGYHRYGILSALINNLSLIFISLFIFYQAVERYLHPAKVEPAGMISVAVLGLLVNTVIVFFLHDGTENINIKSSFLHFIGDALADFGVLLGGVIIYFTGWIGVDTMLSALLACLILRGAVTMSRECLEIFLEKTPREIDLEALCAALCSVPEITAVNDIHVWSISKERRTMTAHLAVDNAELEKTEMIIQKVQEILEERFKIHYSTIQLERERCASCRREQQKLLLSSRWRRFLS